MFHYVYMLGVGKCGLKTHAVTAKDRITFANRQGGIFSLQQPSEVSRNTVLFTLVCGYLGGL